VIGLAIVVRVGWIEPEQVILERMRRFVFSHEPESISEGSARS
jgi:hypothetical protein